MMTEKEKAWDLIETMNGQKIKSEIWNNVSEYTKQDLKRKVSIVIYEVIENLENLCVSHLGTYENPKIHYWKKVKEELEQL